MFPDSSCDDIEIKLNKAVICFNLHARAAKKSETQEVHQKSAQFMKVCKTSLFNLYKHIVVVQDMPVWLR